MNPSLHASVYMVARKEDDDSGPNIMIRVDDPSEKRWTIMAALLGTNMAFALFQGLAQQDNYMFMRHIALIIIISALPFQAIYFMIHAYVLEFSKHMGESQHIILTRLSTLCQVVSYLSLVGVVMMFYATHWQMGFAFTVASIIALILIRLAMNQVSELGMAEENH